MSNNDDKFSNFYLCKITMGEYSKFAGPSSDILLKGMKASGKGCATGCEIRVRVVNKHSSTLWGLR